MPWVVRYEVVLPRGGATTAHEVGPYKDYSEAEEHQRDIATYAFVRDCHIVEAGTPVKADPLPSVVAVDSVIRSTASMVAAVSVLSLAATFLSGAIIIQPIFAVMLLIASVGFFAMTLRAR